MLTQTDIFKTFTDAYVKGNVLDAFQAVISNPNIRYEELHSEESILPYLINYADACVFHGVLVALKANNALQLAIEYDKKLLEKYRDFLAHLKFEYVFLTTAHQGLTFPMALASTLPIAFELVQKILNNSKKLAAVRPELIALIEGTFHPNVRALYPFAYPKACFKQSVINPQGDIPLIFLEPILDLDYAALFADYLNKPKIFVVESLHHFMHLLQFDSIMPLFSDSSATIYILDIHHAQQNAVTFDWSKDNTFKSIMMTDNPAYTDAIPYLTKSMANSQIDLLYPIAKRLLSRINSEKYGKSRSFALNRLEGIQNWNDPNRPQISADIDLGPAPINYVDQILAEYKQKQQKRAFKRNGKFRLAHIVPQIIDGGHAPSRVLRQLTSYSHRNLFDTIIISTECFSMHNLEYPFCIFSTPPSTIRAKITIENLEKQGINVFTLAPNTSYESSAALVNTLLEQFDIDVAVFHGPDQINSIASCSSSVPLSILFEHGTTKASPGYDVAIISTQAALNAHKEELDKHHIKSYALPFCTDVYQTWEKEPYTREQLGLPKDAFVMTTISNHLEVRLTNEMCHAIGKILQRSPQAFYAPMGNISNPQPIMKIFELYGVENRIKFLGAVAAPSQIARSMNLYLNEFPFGSCLGMLDAMAAGCPVVSMYDENGPAQAVYGGAYFGVDYVIKSGKTSDYVELACRLISDKSLYQHWSQHALEEFKKHSNVKEYNQTFEQIIQTALNELKG